MLKLKADLVASVADCHLAAAEEAAERLPLSLRRRAFALESIKAARRELRRAACAEDDGA